jgi:hypothetical protein
MKQRLGMLAITAHCLTTKLELACSVFREQTTFCEMVLESRKVSSPACDHASAAFINSVWNGLPPLQAPAKMKSTLTKMVLVNTALLSSVTTPLPLLLTVSGTACRPSRHQQR